MTASASLGSGCDDGSGSNSNSSSSAGLPAASTALTLEEELQESDPPGGAGERGGPRVSDRIRLESQIHAAAPCPQLLPHQGMVSILEDPGGA